MTSTRDKRYQGILVVIGLIAAMGFAGTFDYEEEQRQAEQYCEMVKIWEQTNGQTGWPPYDKEIDCTRYSTMILEYPDVPSYPLNYPPGVLWGPDSVPPATK